MRDAFPAELLRDRDAALPEVSEPQVVRHYTRLSHRNHSIDLGFYPLGSCTMKYNPKINDEVARVCDDLHPLQPAETCPGILEVMYRTIELLCKITGMASGTLQPYAGAHGEFTGMKIFRAFFRSRGEARRRVILVPDSAHGTNPASAHIAGFHVREVRSNGDGIVDAETIEPYLTDELAGIMLTNPNTLGLFERHVLRIAELIHEAGGLLYYDGANLNAIVGGAKPGDMGFDVVHVNLHKTFSTPHGGGGPGSGPVLVTDTLAPFLPGPTVAKTREKYELREAGPASIGRVAGFHGNIGVVVRAFAYLLSMGRDGLRAVSRLSVLNANYLRERLRPMIGAAYDEARCMHEFVLSARSLKERTGVSAMDIAKRLLDYGVHAPTVYFPLNVPEALMVEPTETETLETLDEFVDIVAAVCSEAERDGDLLREAPYTTPVRRVDEVRAARHPVLTWGGDTSIRSGASSSDKE